MIRNGHPAMRACSLPPENVAVVNGFYPATNDKVEHLYQKNPNIITVGGKMRVPTSVDLGIPEDVFPPGSDYDPSSPTSADVLNGNNKHSPSDCSSAFTDEDSGCQMYYFGNALRTVPKCRMGRACSVSTLDSPSVQSFQNRDEFLAAMTEDLADWMSRLYPQIAKDIDPENFFDRISDGVLLCHHATELHCLLAEEFPANSNNGERRLEGIQIGGVKPILPPNPPTFQSRGFSAVNLAGGSFWARDNVANFIHWCRAMRLPDCILFETEDLVSKKNLRSVVICLLELARIGGRVGMEVPEIVYLEKEIDDEIALGDRAFVNDCETTTLNLPSFDWSGDTNDLGHKSSSTSVGTDEVISSDIATEVSVPQIPRPVSKTAENRLTKASILREKKVKEDVEKRRRREAQTTKQQEEEETETVRKRYNRPVVDMRSLDEIVREKLAQCTCEQTFPMIRLSEGRYLFGDKSTQIFIRILRNHVMVRVGGGWDTLDHFLQKYDECRKVQQPHSPTSTDKRSYFKKNHPHSVDDGMVDMSNISDLVNAVSNGHRQSGARNGDSVSVLGEGNLKVSKKGREVVYTTTEVVPHLPSKCNHHCPKPKEELIINAEEVEEKKHLTPSSSIEDLIPTPVIKQVDEKYCGSAISPTSPVDPIDNLIQIEVDEKESIFARTEVANKGIPQIRSPSTAEVQTIPVIDQVVSGFDEKVKPLHIADSSLEKSPAKSKIKPNPLPSPYKPGPNSPNRRIPTSASAYSIKREKSTSVHNLSTAGKGIKPSSLGKFSQSTVSLTGLSTARRFSKPTTSQPTRSTDISANQRAKSISDISTSANATPRSRQPANTSKTDVFERLSANTKRNTTAPKIVNPPATNMKRRASLKHPENNVTENNNTPAMRRRNSVNTVKKIIYTDDKPVAAKAPTNTATTKRESQRTLKPSGSAEIRRSSVARMPAEGSRIPRPAKVLTVSELRSKSVGPSAYSKSSLA
ncbi:unnamed protein product [Hymenolepis diminuta]|uniref:GAR domain-containing protein n=1 Tax=Hymenolepis diminuta TaxID=6216 RepID=A0A564XV20_HYMDI|nr:unnamed protein product [Hymenolepis diminuta]